MQVWWRSGHLSARRSDLRKTLQTDRRTDDGRRAIALAHSWNELKCVSVSRYAFTSKTTMSNFIPIRLETTEP